jgi:hypothetical protein
MDEMTIIQLFHVFLIGPLLLYIGIIRNKIPNYLYSILFYLSIYLLIFHSYKIYKNLSIGKIPWINYMHVFIIFPLLFYTGYYKTNTPRFIFEYIFMLAFAVIGYNSYYLLVN